MRARLLSRWMSLILICCTLLASCAPAPTATPVPATATPSVIKLTDAVGQQLTLQKLPQRIIVMGRGPYMALHLLYLFPEGRQRLVAAEKKGSTISDFLPFVDPNFANLPYLNANPGIESILAFKPDLVIMKNTVMDTIAKNLTDLGIGVLNVDLETPDSMFKDIRNMGAVLGNSKRAEELIAYYQSRVDRVSSVTSKLSAAEKPRALLLEYSDRNGPLAIKVPPEGWMQTIEVKTAGGNPVWLDAAESGGWTVVNFEQVAVWNPDKIFLVIWYTMDPVKVIQTLKADPQWSALKAIKNNDVWAFPSDIFGWDSPEPRWILGMTWLATRLYPDKLTGVDMQREIYDFFALYGMDKASVDTVIMPKVKMDIH